MRQKVASKILPTIKAQGNSDTTDKSIMISKRKTKTKQKSRRSFADAQDDEAFADAQDDKVKAATPLRIVPSAPQPPKPSCKLVADLNAYVDNLQREIECLLRL